MTRRQAIIIYGPTVVAVAAFFLFEAFGSIIADGSVTVAVTVRSTEPLKLRRVTYDEFRRREDVDECLRNPPPNEALFRDAAVTGPQSFQFDVRTSSRISPFGILMNWFYWRPFAVFRIETDAGRVVFVGVEVPDVRDLRTISIDVEGAWADRSIGD